MIKGLARSLGYDIRRMTTTRPPHRTALPEVQRPKLASGSADPRGMLPDHEPQQAYKYLPSTNADGRLVIPMTDEQRYVFDLKGWLVLPGLLGAAELDAVREHVLRFHRDRGSLPSHERFECAGAAEMLLDHPAVVGVLNEILSYQPLAAEECYGFRCDGVFMKVRRAGDDHFDPHSGGGMHALVGNSHIYQCAPGRVHAGLTRVVWELNDVPSGDRGEGGSLLLSGSHKAAFPRPPVTDDRRCPLYETYGCPAGSAVIFTESIVHSYGSLWSCPDHDRLAVFVCYNTVNAKWHRGCPPDHMIAAMAPKRQTLFRAAWVGEGEGLDVNRYYSDWNRAV
jgi:hypothetical protein